jgi:hypothetical protein
MTTPARQPACPHTRGYLVAPDGDVIPASCNTYRCDVCGPRKARRLAKAMWQWVQRECTGGARFWTFTMTNRASANPTEHRRQFQRAWHAFWKELRRCPALSNAQRRARYIAIREVHQSGFVHVHALVDRYLPRSLLQPLWDGICARILGLQGQPAGFVWVQLVPNDARGLARYVTKYVTKSARAFHEQFAKAHLWSRSAGVVLELRKPKRPGWSFVLDLRAATMPWLAETVAAYASSPTAPLPISGLSPPEDGYPF